jgi:hypothetical protein
MQRQRHDAGQSSVLVLVVATVLGMSLTAALADFGGITQDRARAQTAADAAALASLAGGEGAAHDFAMLHGALVISWSRGPGEHEVTVVVRFGDSTATARASNAP